MNLSASSTQVLSHNALQSIAFISPTEIILRANVLWYSKPSRLFIDKIFAGLATYTNVVRFDPSEFGDVAFTSFHACLNHRAYDTTTTDAQFVNNFSRLFTKTVRELAKFIGAHPARLATYASYAADSPGAAKSRDITSLAILVVEVELLSVLSLIDNAAKEIDPSSIQSINPEIFAEKFQRASMNL